MNELLLLFGCLFVCFLAVVSLSVKKVFLSIAAVIN